MLDLYHPWIYVYSHDLPFIIQSNLAIQMPEKVNHKKVAQICKNIVIEHGLAWFFLFM